MQQLPPEEACEPGRSSASEGYSPRQVAQGSPLIVQRLRCSFGGWCLEDPLPKSESSLCEDHSRQHLPENPRSSQPPSSCSEPSPCSEQIQGPHYHSHSTRFLKDATDGTPRASINPSSQNGSWAPQRRASRLPPGLPRPPPRPAFKPVFIAWPSSPPPSPGRTSSSNIGCCEDDDYDADELDAAWDAWYRRNFESDGGNSSSGPSSCQPAARTQLLLDCAASGAERQRQEASPLPLSPLPGGFNFSPRPSMETALSLLSRQDSSFVADYDGYDEDLGEEWDEWYSRNIASGNFPPSWLPNDDSEENAAATIENTIENTAALTAAAQPQPAPKAAVVATVAAAASLTSFAASNHGLGDGGQADRAADVRAAAVSPSPPAQPRPALPSPRPATCSAPAGPAATQPMEPSCWLSSPASPFILAGTAAAAAAADAGDEVPAATPCLWHGCSRFAQGNGGSSSSSNSSSKLAPGFQSGEEPKQGQRQLEGCSAYPSPVDSEVSDCCVDAAYYAACSPSSTCSSACSGSARLLPWEPLGSNAAGSSGSGGDGGECGFGGGSFQESCGVSTLGARLDYGYDRYDDCVTGFECSGGSRSGCEDRASQAAQPRGAKAGCVMSPLPLPSRAAGGRASKFRVVNCAEWEDEAGMGLSAPASAAAVPDDEADAEADVRDALAEESPAVEEPVCPMWLAPHLERMLRVVVTDALWGGDLSAES